MQYGYILKHLRPKKLLKINKIFFYALGFAISQGGIAAHTLTLMQGSEEKRKRTAKLSHLETCHRVQRDLNSNAKFGRRTPLPVHYWGIGITALKCCI